METTTSDGAVLTDIDVVRFLPEHVGFTERGEGEDGDHLGTMDVTFSTFNDWYEINSFFEGRFLERIAPGAFRKTIRERRDQVKVLFNHGRDMTIDNKVLGHITDLREQRDAALGVVELYDTSYNRDLLPGLKDGAYGASFRFETLADSMNHEPGASAHNPDGIPERTITEVRLHEFGPVTFPANPNATAGMRSMTDEYYEFIRARDEQRYSELVARAQTIRTPAASSGDGTGAAPDTDGAGADGHHSAGMTPDQRAAVLRGLQLAALDITT